MSLQIAQFPSYSRLNPALDCYRDALVRWGVAVVPQQLLPRIGSECSFLAWVIRHRSSLDVIHLHWFQRLYLGASWWGTMLRVTDFLSGLVIARRAGVSITWTAHNARPHERPMPLVDRLAYWAVTRMLDHVFVDNPSQGDAVARHYPTLGARMSVVPMGSYLGLYGRMDSQMAARAMLHLPHRATVLLAFGLIRPYKGVEDLIRAVRQAGHEDLVLLVAGEPVDDAMRRRLVQAAGDAGNVVLRLRHVSQADVATVFAACDAVVCNYRDESSSGIVLLAGSMGRAAVVSHALAADLPAEATAIIADSSEEALAQVLATCRNRDWRAAGDVAAQWASRRSWEEAGRRMVAVFSALHVARRAGVGARRYSAQQLDVTGGQ